MNSPLKKIVVNSPSVRKSINIDDTYTMTLSITLMMMIDIGHDLVIVIDNLFKYMYILYMSACVTS